MWTRLTGWLSRVFHRPALLKAQEEPVSVIGFLLVVVQSAAMVLVFGHTEIFRLFSPDIQTVAVAAISLFVLVASTLAGDVTLGKVMRRIGPLRRMQEDALAAWLVAYSVFILGVEGATFAVALWAVEQRPDALFSQTPLLPNSGALLALQIGLRALMLPLTFVMLQITAARLPVGYEVAITKARERVGGMMEETLATTQLAADSLGALMAAWGRLNQPMPRRRTRWNAGAIARDEEYAQRLQAQTQSVVEAFQQLTHDKVAEAEARHAQVLANVQTQAQQSVAAAEARVRQLTETAQRQVEQANAAATQRAVDAILALVAGGALPDWLTAQRPDLANFTLATVVGSGAGRRSSGGNGGKSSAGNTRAERQRVFLVEQGIEPSSAPEGRRGVWLRASDLATLTGGRSGSERPLDLIRRLGDGATVGRNLVAPFEAVMRELSERHLLSDAARMWWTSQAHSGEDARLDTNADQDEMSAASRADSRTNVIAMRA